MARPRANPFDQGTAERVLYDRYRKAKGEAEKHEREASLATTAGQASRAAANRYAEALAALGHGDKVEVKPYVPRIVDEIGRG